MKYSLDVPFIDNEERVRNSFIFKVYANPVYCQGVVVIVWNHFAIHNRKNKTKFDHKQKAFKKQDEGL